MQGVKKEIDHSQKLLRLEGSVNKKRFEGFTELLIFNPYIFLNIESVHTNAINFLNTLLN